VHTNRYQENLVDLTARESVASHSFVPNDVSYWLTKAVPYAFL